MMMELDFAGSNCRGKMTKTIREKHWQLYKPDSGAIAISPDEAELLTKAVSP
jgi:hypothetical protein